MSSKTPEPKQRSVHQRKPPATTDTEQSPDKVIRRVAIAQMVPGLNPRRSWSQEKYQQRKASIQKNGILETGLARPIGQNKYEIIDGLLRWTIAKELGIPDMAVEVREMSDQEVESYAITQFVLREDLNLVDKTDAVLRLLARKVQDTPQAVVALLNRAASERKSPEQSGNVTRSNQWQTIEATLQGIGITPESFRTNWLPILKLPNDILQVIRDGRIEYTKARAIGRIKNVSQRQQILGDAISQNLSIREIRRRIDAVTPTPKSDRQILGRIKRVERELKTVLGDPKRRERVEALLTEIESVLGKNQAE
jgi:ParB family chromosome partitioning protein